MSDETRVHPTEVEANLDSVARMYAAFDEHVRASRASSDWKADWARQNAEWIAFASDVTGITGKLTRAKLAVNPLAGAAANAVGFADAAEVNAEVDQFETELADWQESFAEETGQSGPAGPQPGKPASGKEPINWNRVLLIGGIIAGSVAAAYAIRSLSEASGEARFWHGKLR